MKEFKIDHFALEYQPSYNIAPTRQIVVVKDDGKRHLAQCRWGLIPFWADDPAIGYKMINARAETVAEKPAFKDAFRSQRCLVVANGFFEWRHTGKFKTPVYIRLKSKGMIGFAGLYNVWRSPEGEEISTCAIITTEANDLLLPIHDRMPCIIPKDKEDIWLDPKIKDKEVLMPLLTPYPSDEMGFYNISTIVNKPEHDAPEVILPVEVDV
jgi:putative SOS response-associated peptidase YedK